MDFEESWDEMFSDYAIYGVEDMRRIDRPMLAVEAKIDQIQYPVICSPKYDGIRCLVVDGEVLTRKFLPLPNKYVRDTLANYFKNTKGVVDGELICEGGFNATSSALMSEKGEPKFTYYVFDCVGWFYQPIPGTTGYYPIGNMVYEERLKLRPQENVNVSWYKHAPMYYINNEVELFILEEQLVKEGYEGVIARDPKGEYKEGRSTVLEGGMLKIKRFKDSEAEILDVLPLLENNNPSEDNELGLAKKSKAKAGLVPTTLAGKLLVRDIHSGVEFSIGTGFTKEQRANIYKFKDRYKGYKVKYKYQSIEKDKPRFPVFIGFRGDEDL